MAAGSSRFGASMRTLMAACSVCMILATAAAAAEFSFATNVLSDAVRGVPYNAVIRLSGGKQPYTWFLPDDRLPPGLTLRTNTGVIFGSPVSTGQYGFWVAASDAGGTTISDLFSLAVLLKPNALCITTPNAEDAYAHEGYDEEFEATGGYPPYEWSLASGALPPGMHLEPEGCLHGTPGTNGAFVFTVRVADGFGDVDARCYTLLVYGEEDVTITTEELPTATVMGAYSVKLAAQGGVPPYRWALVDSHLPVGLRLGPDGTIAGRVLEYAGLEDSYYLDVEVVDAAGDFDWTTIELPVETLDVFTVPFAGFGVNLNPDREERDTLLVRFRMHAPVDALPFTKDTDLTVTFGDYDIFTDTDCTRVSRSGYRWTCHYGDPTIDPSIGMRNDVPVITMRMRYSALTRTIYGRVKVRFEDGLGDYLDVEPGSRSFLSVYTLSVELITKNNYYSCERKVPVLYKQRPSGMRGVGRKL